MAYKYKTLKTLAEWIRQGKLPPDLHVKEVYRFWADNHQSSKKQYQRWCDKPRFYNRALTANTRARKLNVEGKVTAQDLELVYAKHEGKCMGCKTNKTLVFDHIVPMYRGGENTKDNLQLLCRLCNMEKGVNYNTLGVSK